MNSIINTCSKYLIGIPLILLIFLVSSCKETEPVDPDYGSVEGMTVFATTNLPVAYVSIEVGDRLCITEGDGHFFIDNIELGEYTLTANKEGFIPFSMPLSVTEEGSEFLGIPLISPAFTCRLYGNITGSFSGNPQPDLSIIIKYPEGGQDLGPNGISGQDGSYEIQMIPHGDWKVIITGSAGMVYEQLLTFNGPEYQLDLKVTEPQSFTDERDGTEYPMIKIGGQVWLGSNMAYMPYVNSPDQASGSLAVYYVYDYMGEDVEAAKQTPNYQKYGVLYNWTAAQSACPDGWHLPSDEEWHELEAFLGMEDDEIAKPKWRSTGAVGVQLKSISDWNDDDHEDGNGSNLSGFNALPAGSRNTNDSFGGIHLRANFWTTSHASDISIFYRSLMFNEDGVYRYFFNGTLGFSVRCVQNQ